MKNVVKIFSLGLIILAPAAHALSISYGHAYEDVTKKNIDILGLEHTFNNNITLGTEWKAVPDAKADGSAGNAFSHENFYEKKFKIKYKYDFNPYYALGPELEYVKKTDGNKYKIKAINDFTLTETDKIYIKLVNEKVDYTNGKATKKMIYAESGYSKKIDKTKITYEYTYYHGEDSKLFNNKNMDYRHKFNVEYKLSSKLKPYIEIRNESINSKSDKRQTIFETGISYSFF